ncbi:polyprenyl synthetase family protein [Octadecabacter algicola]|uniref:polyprenyl synthetase family protein n=1 Tax=Octadecabacter algicola TaxID=2909342 RepID=UPI003AB94A10
MPFREALEQTAEATAVGIKVSTEGYRGDVADAMRYAVEGGKGLRAFFVYQSAHLHKVNPIFARMAAEAIECLHAYSLVHDDLPCMDDDDLRRGQPTVHRKWDEATAVLAGDALQALAFERASSAGMTDEARVKMVLTLAQAAGIGGMVGGQAADIAAETATAPLTLDQIIALQAGKTGALITWACTAGPTMAQDDPSALRTYGDKLGLAFQIADDILDVEGDAATVGKAVGKDEAAGKATFVSLLGLDGAKSRADELVESACDALSVYGKAADTLRDAARFVVNRSH